MNKSGVWADTPQRLLTMAVGLPIILGIVFVGTPLSTIAVIIVSSIAVYELYHISHLGRKWLWLFLIGAVIYIIFPMTLLVLIRNSDKGLSWTLLLLITNWTTDSMALVGGRMFGKRKLAPRISSGKTWEGAEVGFISGCCAGWLIGVIAILPTIIVLIAPPVVAIMTILGDLLESRIKRGFKVKDASHLLPGHGGFLDRLDGLLLALPVFFVIISL